MTTQKRKTDIKETNTKIHIETTVFEFTVLLGKSTELAEEMFKAVSTIIASNIVLSSHLSTIDTRVETSATREKTYQRV